MFNVKNIDNGKVNIFFDFDGTLIDISKRHYLVYRDTVVQLGGKPLYKDYYWKLKRKNINWEEIISKSNLSPDNFNTFLNRFVTRIESIDYLRYDTVITNARTTLNILKKSHKLFLVSYRRNRRNLNIQLEKLRLKDKFEKIICSSKYSKTVMIKKLLGTKSGIVVGDTEVDIEAAKDLDSVSVAVLTGIRNRSVLVRFKPNYIIRSVSELPRVINQL